MGSIIAVSDHAGGHHFNNRMFGGASTHHQTQLEESPQAHVSTHSNSSLRAPADVSMVDASIAARGPPSSSQPPTRTVPPSPRMQPQPPQHQSPGHVAPTPPGQARSRQHSSASASAQQSPMGTVRSPPAPANPSPRRIKVENLAHIQSFANDESMRSSWRRQRRDGEVETQYNISEMPVSDVIEMVAGLLTKITTTNDQHHRHLHRHVNPPEAGQNLDQQTTSVLAFHGKNVPSITILSYLSRIHKYCPTTYEVFLSLLVYFDRMTERVNPGMRQATQQPLDRRDTEKAPGHHASGSSPRAERHTPQTSSLSAQAATPPPSGSLGKPAEAEMQGNHPTPPTQQIDPPLEAIDPLALSQFFVVDSYNIHRLVIAGVTCASKFFSDVFYTNSRYAKVGGLPLNELNHLELQFLILNDFRLAVPLEEMEAYGTMLVEFYAREVVEQNTQPAGERSHATAQ